MAAWAAIWLAESAADDCDMPTCDKLDVLVEGMLGSNKPGACECFRTWPARAGGSVRGDAFRVPAKSLAVRLGREKFWGLPRPGELGKGGLARPTGVWGALVLGREMVSSVDEVSILRIMGREGAAAAAALEVLEVLEVLEELEELVTWEEALAMEPGTRGEKLPGALCWGRDCCIVWGAIAMSRRVISKAWLLFLASIDYILGRGTR